MTPHFFYISDIANSSSFNGEIFRKKSILENFRANVLKYHPDITEIHSKTEIHALIRDYFYPKHFYIFDNCFDEGARKAFVSACPHDAYLRWSVN